MNKKSAKGFNITQDYRLLTIWFFQPTGELSGTVKVRPDKGKNRRERYDILADNLNIGDRDKSFTMPAYEPKRG